MDLPKSRTSPELPLGCRGICHLPSREPARLSPHTPLTFNQCWSQFSTDSTAFLPPQQLLNKHPLASLAPAPQAQGNKFHKYQFIKGNHRVHELLGSPGPAERGWREERLTQRFSSDLSVNFALEPGKSQCWGCAALPPARSKGLWDHIYFLYTQEEPNGAVEKSRTGC